MKSIFEEGHSSTGKCAEIWSPHGNQTVGLYPICLCSLQITLNSLEILQDNRTFMYTIQTISSTELRRMYCDSVSLRSNCSHQTSHHLTLCQPFCWTNLYYYSFLPYTLSLWNKLDSSIVSSSSPNSFKQRLMEVHA